MSKLKRSQKILIAVVGAILLTILIIRIFTPEDSWIKDSNGNWIKHGSPAGTPPN